MAFPTNKSEVIDTVTTVLAIHINNLEDKVGIDGSADVDSLDYKVAQNTAKNTNVPTALSAGTVTSTSYGITSDGGVDDIILPEADTDNAGLLGADKWDEIVANTGKTTNATHTGDVTGSTVLTIGADKVHDSMIDWGTGASQVSAGDVPIADTGSKITATEVEGALQENRTAIDLNTAKVTNATHSGEVTGATTLTIVDNIVDEANLKVNAPTNDYVLTADDGEAGGMKWAVAPGGGNVSTSGTPIDNDFAKFVNNTDIEGRSYAEVRTDLNIENGADVTDSVNMASSIVGVAGKATPIDADTIPMIDSADSNKLKELTWANLKATIKTWYDSVTATLTNKTLTSPVLNTGVSGTAVLDEDDMASDSATKVATQQSIKAYVGDSGYEWQGPWVTSTAYILNDTVEHDGSGYVCIEAHTSGVFATDLSASKWEMYVEGGLNLLMAIYPVGSLYFNGTVSTNPATLLGFGTWSLFGAGRVLVCRDAGDADFDSTAETGGAKTHTLTTAEMPAHAHNFYAGGRTTTWAAPNFMGTYQYQAATGVNYGGIVQSTGSGNAHNNVQPYIVVNTWRRTA